MVRILIQKDKMEPTKMDSAGKHPAPQADALIIRSLAKLDGIALGISLGTLFGLVVFLATNILVIKGGEVIGPNLGLLAEYFIGFRVTFAGSVIGLGYGFGLGFIIGWLIALLRNLIITIYIFLMKLRTNMSAINDFIDHP